LTPEPEYKLLSQFVMPGDWIIDIGANVGHYTKKFSDLVGPEGRVIAIEPVPATFSILSANCQSFSNANVTLFNVAASEMFDVAGMEIPKFKTGLANYYEAHILPSCQESTFNVLTIPLDALCINSRIKLVKIDTEGHEKMVLKGMRQLLKQYHPILIVEAPSDDTVSFLSDFGYVSEKLPDSPNLIFKVCKNIQL